ncbi:MAG: hypothetical protein RBR67_08110 [Desulfobacterium sp.]|nr:hypothetical protein [Desulfobacterium sp.]
MAKKKKNTNRQAKKNRKRQKTKKQLVQDFSPKSKQKSSRDGFTNPIISKAVKLIEPPDGIKMSAVILKIAEPLLIKFGDDEKRVKTIISLAVIEWNKQSFQKEEQDNLQESMINSFFPSGGNAEDIGSILYIQDLIAERKNKYFPDLKKVVLGYDLKFIDGNFTLNVSSVPFP